MYHFLPLDGWGNLIASLQLCSKRIPWVLYRVFHSKLVLPLGLERSRLSNLCWPGDLLCPSRYLSCLSKDQLHGWLLLQLQGHGYWVLSTSWLSLYVQFQHVGGLQCLLVSLSGLLGGPHCVGLSSWTQIRTPVGGLAGG